MDSILISQKEQEKEKDKEQDKEQEKDKEEDKDKDKEEIASGNLDNNKVITTIEPETHGNYLYISICSCSINCALS